MERVRDLVARGIIPPVIARRFPLERIAEADGEAEAGGPHWSVIVTVHARERICGARPSARRQRVGGGTPLNQ
jgi:hypothetical protein